MRTNIEIDDKLLKDAMKIAGVSTKKAAVETALQRMIQIERQAGLRRLRGKVDFYPDVLEELATRSNSPSKAAR